MHTNIIIASFLISIFSSFGYKSINVLSSGESETNHSWIVTLADNQGEEEVSIYTDRLEFADITAVAEVIYKRKNIALLTLSGLKEKKYEVQFLNRMIQDGIILDYKENLEVKYRSTNPNDPQFINQWNMAKIDMPLAWDITTGGLTAAGDTIVIAILDSGFDVSHQDLKGNIWLNHEEIPNDGIDNDNNGYIDDYAGLNTKDNNDIHPISEHGNGVAGIIGGIGDNNTSIAGMNWNIKMMFISGITTEANIIECYAYVLDSRENYNFSGGEQGAFVVSTNLSAGIDFALAEDHPIWCRIYDDLGKVGVLNCGATANLDIDVDDRGDMPTTCKSDYLIAVTGTDQDDNRYFNAGYGLTSVDIAAPGSELLTTGVANGTQDFPGNSAATPHIAGMVGLIYANACEEYLELLKSNPETKLIELKQVILNSSDMAPDLDGITVSGRRLNAFGVLKGTAKLCGVGAGEEISIVKIQPNPSDGEIDIFFEVANNEPHELHIIDMMGRLVYREILERPLFSSKQVNFKTNGLSAGIYYATIRKDKEVASQKFLVL